MRAQFAVFLVCTVLCPRILEALKNGAVCFHSDPELYWSPGAWCSFQTTTLKCALASIFFSTSYLLAGNREGMPSRHYILAHLHIHSVTVFSRNVWCSQYMQLKVLNEFCSSLKNLQPFHVVHVMFHVHWNIDEYMFPIALSFVVLLKMNVTFIFLYKEDLWLCCSVYVLVCITVKKSRSCLFWKTFWLSENTVKFTS